MLKLDFKRIRNPEVIRGIMKIIDTINEIFSASSMSKWFFNHISKILPPSNDEIGIRFINPINKLWIDMYLNKFWLGDNVYSIKNNNDKNILIRGPNSKIIISFL